ncbi:MULTISPECIES: flagellar biosynthetic protein FliO [Clostridium]|uniref:flagellar biosynthetic protein FliO n=1 Tax=Clostridium TaxID=1485 RepID=UPI0006697AB5|nr:MULTISPECIES: flagellar biosynthetic protein FliO [Clostridium]MDB2105255.1 flagellar biosynthetic protein FliO [Clostridium paraputrificum]MDB2112256.1 flagellar biosynthetic protein FliO [Clostridium paraputrificum]MDU4937069.1 flagellar biosynthetic protein FliO [Clostridium sp.]
MDFTLMIFKLIVSMIVIFALMIILFKYANKGINGNLNKKYVKVIERVQISKDGYILVVKVGNKGMVLSTSTGHTEKLQELSEEELAEIEEAKQQALKDMNNKYEGILNNFKSLSIEAWGKIKSKEDRHE